MKRILIVDDDPDVLESAAMILEEGYQVALARNGVDALRRIQSESFDAILLDLAMPEKDGASVVFEMTARNIRVPVILVSADHDLAGKARSLGVADHLHKPFNAAALEAKVAALVEPRREGERKDREERVRRGERGASASMGPSASADAGFGIGMAKETSRDRSRDSVSDGVSSLNESGMEGSPGILTQVPQGPQGGAQGEGASFAADVLHRARVLADARNLILADLQHTAPDAFFLHCAKRLGVLQGDEIVMSDMGDQLAFVDYCTYAFETRGRSAFDLYRAQCRARPGSQEHMVLAAMERARFSIFEVKKRMGTDSAALVDMLTGARHVVVDDDVVQKVGTRLACRVMPFQEFSLLTAPCHVFDRAGAEAVLLDLAHMGTDARTRLASQDKKWQTELAAWLLRTRFLSKSTASRHPSSVVLSFSRH